MCTHCFSPPFGILLAMSVLQMHATHCIHHNVDGIHMCEIKMESLMTRFSLPTAKL